MKAHSATLPPATLKPRSVGRPKLFPQVKQGIEQLIQTYDLQPGMALESEKQLAQRFAVSRPLVRKALRELADENRIITLPGKGHFVADPQSALATAAGTILCVMGSTQYSAIWNDSHVACIAEGMEQVIGATDHRLLFELVSTYKGGKHQSQVPLDNLCGILLVPLANQAVQPLLDTLPADVPCVIIGRPSPRPDIFHVIVDHDQAVRMGMQHLLQNGHRQIAYIGGMDDAWHTKLRYNAYRTAMEQQGCHDPSLCLGISDHPVISRQQLAQNLKAILPRVTALFVGSGVYLNATLACVKESGRRIGKDLSIITYDDTPAALEYDPPLTTIAQPTHQLGVAGAEILLQQMHHNAGPITALNLQGELIIRQSVVPIHPLP